MTHLELVAQVAEQADMSEDDVRRILDTAFAAIVEEVARGDKVVVGHFGTFKPGLKRRAPRSDPKAPRKTKLVLTPSLTLNDQLNG